MTRTCANSQGSIAKAISQEVIHGRVTIQSLVSGYFYLSMFLDIYVIRFEILPSTTSTGFRLLVHNCMTVTAFRFRSIVLIVFVGREACV